MVTESAQAGLPHSQRRTRDSASSHGLLGRYPKSDSFIRGNRLFYSSLACYARKRTGVTTTERCMHDQQSNCSNKPKDSYRPATLPNIFRFCHDTRPGVWVSVFSAHVRLRCQHGARASPHGRWHGDDVAHIATRSQRTGNRGNHRPFLRGSFDGRPCSVRGV